MKDIVCDVVQTTSDKSPRNKNANAEEYQNGKYEVSNDEIKKNRAAQKEVGTEIDNNSTKTDTLNTKLGKSEIKEVTINTNKDVDDENKKWSSPISKTVNVITSGLSQLKFWAEGTNYHPGGKAVLGEEGPELVNVGGRMSLASFGIYDLPTGAKVYTNDETVSMLRNGLVDGISQGVNAQRNSLASTNGGTVAAGGNSDLVSILTEQSQLLMQLLGKDTTINMDGREVGRLVEPHVTETQNRTNYIRINFAHKMRRGFGTFFYITDVISFLNR